MNKILILILLPLLFACSHVISAIDLTYRIEEKYDKYNELNIVAMKRNIIDSQLVLNAVKKTSKDSISTYQMELEYTGLGKDDWLHIGKGKSLLIRIDGEQYEFAGEGSSLYRKTDEEWQIFTNEKSCYDIEPKIFNLIGNAKTIKIRVIGSKKEIDREISDKARAIFINFYTQYCENH